jgi:hypothetical protein
VHLVNGELVGGGHRDFGEIDGERDGVDAEKLL